MAASFAKDDIERRENKLFAARSCGAALPQRAGTGAGPGQVPAGWGSMGGEQVLTGPARASLQVAGVVPDQGLELEA